METLMNILPLYDRLLVQVIDTEQTSSGGIILTKEQNQKAVSGHVLAVGKGFRNKDSSYISPLTVKVGDTIIFSKYSCTEIHIPNQDNLFIVREDDVLAIMNTQ